MAKLFADAVKPFGAVAVLDRAHERELMAKLPVTEIAGIAMRRAASLEPYGVKTCLDFANADGGVIKRILTVTGYDLWRELNGERCTAIRPERAAHKMISRGGSLAGRVRDPFTLYGWLVRNIERLIEELNYHTVRLRTLTLYLSYHDAPSTSGTIRFPAPTDHFDDLLEAAKAVLNAGWRPGLCATHMHLIASELVRPAGWFRAVFDPPDAKGDAVAQVKREINAKFGRFTLRSGATLYANDYYRDPANMHDVCDVRGKHCF
jgi:DNA polymerase V